MSSNNHIEIAENYEAMKLDLARAIIAGKIKATPENQAFYESWAYRYIEWRKANYRGRGEAAEPQVVVEAKTEGEQGRLF